MFNSVFHYWLFQAEAVDPDLVEKFSTLILLITLQNIIVNKE